MAGASRWSSEGCYLRGLSSSTADCMCTHTTNFALLTEIPAAVEESEHEVRKSVEVAAD